MLLSDERIIIFSIYEINIFVKSKTKKTTPTAKLVLYKIFVNQLSLGDLAIPFDIVNIV